MMVVLAVLIIVGQVGLQLLMYRFVKKWGAFRDEMRYTHETNMLVHEATMRLLAAIREQQTSQRLNREIA